MLNSVSDLRLGFRSVTDGALDVSPWRYLSDDPLRHLPRVPPAGLAAVADTEAPAAAPAPHGVCLQVDELGGGGGLTLHGAMRLFERQRTCLIGGPGALKLLQDGGVMVVVG